MAHWFAGAIQEPTRITSHGSMLDVRMDTEIKRKATAALAAMGLTASEAVRLFFHRIAVDQTFHLETEMPNADDGGELGVNPGVARIAAPCWGRSTSQWLRSRRVAAQAKRGTTGRRSQRCDP